MMAAGPTSSTTCSRKSFATRSAALAAAHRVAQEQHVPGNAATIEFQDEAGRWHTEFFGRRRPAGGGCGGLKRLPPHAAFRVLLQPRHQLDQVAGPVPGIELEQQDVVPGILAGAGAARQGEQIGAVGDAAERAATASSLVPIFR